MTESSLSSNIKAHEPARDPQHQLDLFRSRRLLLLIDDSIEPARATIISPAENSSPEIINELLSLSGGLTFVALSPARIRAFLLSPMSRPRTRPDQLNNNSTPLNAYESVEAREGVTTGISAADRALTISILGEQIPHARKLVKPGHIFPIETRQGGVLVKTALPEGAVDVVRLSGFTDAAVYMDLLGPDGEFLNPTLLQKFSETHALPVIKLSELTRLRLEHESLVTKVAEAKLPTHGAGEVRCVVYRSALQQEEHLALIKGTIDPSVPILTRVQPEFTFGDAFGGAGTPTRSQINRALGAIAKRGQGVLVYLRRPFAGQLGEQLLQRDCSFQQRPVWMMREYGVGAQILRDLGVRKVDLLTGSQRNLVGLKSFGIEIVSQQSIPL